MINNYMQYLPNIDAEEMAMLQGLTADLNAQQLQQFVSMYSARRKDSQTILLTCLLGFIGISGIHRFILDQVGMGILYLLTGGLCAIGTIVDLINYRKLTLEYNQKQAYQVSATVKGGYPTYPVVQ